jgi:regulatory protein
MRSEQATATQEALHRAVRLLARRARSSHEISESLTRAGFKAEVVETVVLRLGELRLLDDAEFAAECASQALARGRSAEWIRQDLLQRGVAASAVQVALDELDACNSEYRRALEVARRRRGAVPDVPTAKAYGRLMGYLCRRGYDAELAAKVCRKVVGEEPGVIDPRSTQF